MKLTEATDTYIKELQRRNFVNSTIANYRSLFRLWIAFGRSHCLTNLSDYNQVIIRNFLDSWHVQPSTAKTRYKMLRAFFVFATDMDWINQSPMAKLKPPKVTQIPTPPLTREEFQSLALAAENLPGERALIFLMRYSGLSIGDAVGCRMDAINGDTLTLHRTKTGELVVVPLPDLVLDSLREIEGVFGTDHYFWSGTILRVSATKQWRMKLQHVGRIAGLQNFRPHQLRDTFAVEFLIASRSIEDLSALLGHSSVITTELYYAPWVMARRDRLIRIVKEVNDSDSMLRFLTERMRKKKAGAGDNGSRFHV
ncbi:MAG: site-specific integrase [Bryobacterales bacterium]|nr:site-specific integrase [Bryobacterales bacterium]